MGRNLLQSWVNLTIVCPLSPLVTYGIHVCSNVFASSPFPVQVLDLLRHEILTPTHLVILNPFGLLTAAIWTSSKSSKLLLVKAVRVRNNSFSNTAGSAFTFSGDESE